MLMLMLVCEVLLNLFLHQVLNHHPPFFFLIWWVGAVPLPQIKGVPLTFLSDISCGDPWKIIIMFSNANTNANPNANAKVLLNLFLQQSSPSTNPRPTIDLSMFAEFEIKGANGNTQNKQNTLPRRWGVVVELSRPTDADRKALALCKGNEAGHAFL